MNDWLYVIFAVLWIVTFIPAWRLLLRLLAISVSDKPLGINFVSAFILYRLIIALPYLVLLIFGQSLPGMIRSVVLGVLVLGVILSLARFFLRDQVAALLWGIYSYVYDGLLNFYPYKNLIEMVALRVEQSGPRHVLDAGCGTGNLSLRLASSHDEMKITAIDPSSKMIRRAARKLKVFPNVTVQNSGVSEYLQHHQDSKFDVIALVNVLYALDSPQQFWKPALKHLKKGGRIVITNSDRGGSWPIIKEHLDHSRLIKLLRPSLIAVFVIDLFISQLAKTGKFHFVGMNELQSEIEEAGGLVLEISRCYGGEKNGVNLLFTVTAKQ